MVKIVWIAYCVFTLCCNEQNIIINTRVWSGYDVNNYADQGDRKIEQSSGRWISIGDGLRAFSKQRKINKRAAEENIEHLETSTEPGKVDPMHKIVDPWSNLDSNKVRKPKLIRNTMETSNNLIGEYKFQWIKTILGIHYIKKKNYNYKLSIPIKCLITKIVSSEYNKYIKEYMLLSF